MNPLHLFWIIPLSCSVGALILAIFAANGEKGRRDMQ